MQENGNTRMEDGFVAHYRDLKVFQKAYAVSLRIHQISLEFPKTEQYALADQLRRSSKSVCANIVEGYGRQRQSKPEFKRFIMIAIGSAEETTLWLTYALDLSYLSQEQFTQIEAEYASILKMLHSLRNKS
jgi:four helix bundle protein